MKSAIPNLYVVIGWNELNMPEMVHDDFWHDREAAEREAEKLNAAARVAEAPDSFTVHAVNMQPAKVSA